MRLSISTLVCPNWSLPQIVGAASAHGVQGIDFRGLGAEIDITRLDIFNEEIENTVALLARHRLAVACLNTSIALITPAPERWEMMLDECHRHARLAKQLGAQSMRVFGGMVPKGMKREEAVVMARRHLKQLCRICGPQGCRPLVETHDDWASSEAMLELLGETSGEETGVVWDVEHPFRRGEMPEQTARALKSFVKHIHFKDSTRREGTSIPRLLGEGELPLQQTMNAIRGIEYGGWICLETEKRWHPQEAPEPEESIPQFVGWMRGEAKDMRRRGGA